MSWLTSLGAIAELIIQIIAIFKKAEVRQLGVDLKNAKTVADKQAIARRISEHFYGG